MFYDYVNHHPVLKTPMRSAIERYVTMAGISTLISPILLHELTSITALLYYDHLLTFPWEIELVWKARFTCVSFLFLLNRYLTLLGYVAFIYFQYQVPVSPTVRSINTHS